MKRLRNSRKRNWMRVLVCMCALAVSIGCGRCPDNQEVFSGYRNDGQEVSVNHTGNVKLMPVGTAVGIYIQSNGLMVLGTSEILAENGVKVQPAKNLVVAGDYILEVNHQKISTTDEMVDVVRQSRGNAMVLTVERDGKTFEKTVHPVRTSDGTYKIGIWVRDDAQGIGTLSFIDENNRFAALGHGIVDVDTGEIIQISGGGLYPANVYSVVKGRNGKAGEMVGHILYGNQQKFADIFQNTNEGIYGKITKQDVYHYDEEKAINVGFKEEMHVGKASVRCQINGVVDDFEVNISGIDYNDNNRNKDFVIEVTDRRLLEATGGIVQGMSGSPVIQDGKFVGVVTHVFVNDPTKGYGIFIENMLDKAENPAVAGFFFIFRK